MSKQLVTEKSAVISRAGTSEGYALMRRLRLIDERFAALVDAGEIGFLPRSAGREIALVSTVQALEPTDWVFPTPLDWPVGLVRGLSLSALVHRVFGNALDPLRGRDMPGGLCGRDARIASASAPAATQLPHAVGAAWAAQQRGESTWALALFDGAEVDAPDFHTGLNFAGVMKTPVLFVCRVRPGQESAADHAIAYGLEAHTVDGADPDAVRATVRNARASGRPAVIDVQLRSESGALDELRTSLEVAGKWDAAQEKSLADDTHAELNQALAAARAAGAPSASSIVEEVFADRPPHLRAQEAELTR